MQVTGLLTQCACQQRLDLPPHCLPPVTGFENCLGHPPKHGSWHMLFQAQDGLLTIEALPLHASLRPSTGLSRLPKA